jgi:hypothetical protein
MNRQRPLCVVSSSNKEAIMFNATKALVAFGLAAGAATLTMPGTDIAKAQGVYIDGPGIHARIGHRYYRDRYYRDYRGYRGYDDYAYAPRRRSLCGPYRTLQDGVCKPYRGY